LLATRHGHDEVDVGCFKEEEEENTGIEEPFHQVNLTKYGAFSYEWR